MRTALEAAQNRSIKDRRKESTPALSWYTFFGSRKGIRRKEDRKKGGYVDRYGSGLFLLLISILALNLLDTIFTMMILERGGHEFNPFVRAAIHLYGDKFFLWKFGIVSFCLILLCLHSQFKLVKKVLVSIHFFYLAVVLYQVVLLTI